MLCAWGLRGGVGDDGFAVADDDVLTCERLELGGQITGATILVAAALGAGLAGRRLVERNVPPRVFDLATGDGLNSGGRVLVLDPVDDVVGCREFWFRVPSRRPS